jgi:hypothetical protein
MKISSTFLLWLCVERQAGSYGILKHLLKSLKIFPDYVMMFFFMYTFDKIMYHDITVIIDIFKSISYILFYCLQLLFLCFNLALIHNQNNENVAGILI